MKTVSIEIPEKLATEVGEFLSGYEFQEIKRKRFDGLSVVTLLVGLTTASLPVIANIINTRIKANEKIEVKYKGVTIKGLGEKSTKEILIKMLEND